MASVGYNKHTRRNGMATFARASLLQPATLREVELEYINYRNWYAEQVNRLEQADECRRQAAIVGDKDTERSASNILHAINSNLVDARERLRRMGEASYAEAFFFLAEKMLPKEAFIPIDEETKRLLGRERHEVKKATP